MVGRLPRGPQGADGRYVVARVRGACLEPAVRDGSLVYADRDRDPAPGNYVLATVAGQAVVKRFEVLGGAAVLTAARSLREPIPVTPTTVRLVGVVVATVIDLVAS